MYTNLQIHWFDVFTKIPMKYISLKVFFFSKSVSQMYYTYNTNTQTLPYITTTPNVYNFNFWIKLSIWSQVSCYAPSMVYVINQS